MNMFSKDGTRASENREILGTDNLAANDEEEVKERILTEKAAVLM